MIIDWTYDLIVATILTGAIFIRCIFWIKSILRIFLLLLGFLGIWLAIIQPKWIKKTDKISTEVSSIMEFLSSDEAFITDTVILKGRQHSLSEISLLSDYLLVKEDSILPAGFTRIDLPSKIIEGEQFQIDGDFYRGEDTIVKIWIHNTDSVIARINGTSFSISTQSPAKGLYEYDLFAALNTGDTIREILPIEVVPAAKLSMLLVASSPQFDINYLKNYWTSLGHSVMQKVRISKNKYSTGFVNSEKADLEEITASILKSIDVLYIDILAWNELDKREQDRIFYYIRNEGLGLILRPTSRGVNAEGLPEHSTQRLDEIEIAGIPITKATFNSARSWKRIENGQLLKRGLGKIMLLGVTDSYKLILGDQSTTYQDMWGGIFSQLFVNFSDGIEVTSKFIASEGEYSELHLSYLSPDVTYVLNDKEKLKINYTPLLDGYGNARITGRQGWNKVSSEDSSDEAWFYLHSKNSWQSIKTKAVNDFIKYKRNLNLNDTSTTYSKEQAIPWWVSLMILVFGFGTLWLLEKWKG